MEGLSEAAKSSKVYEDRIDLIDQLGKTSVPTSKLYKTIQDLIAFWDENLCNGILHCKCNMYIIHVAQQCLPAVDACNTFCQFALLSIKASKWCRIHFTSLFPCEENHLATYSELLLSSFNFATAIYSDPFKSSNWLEESHLQIIEELVSEHFNLIKNIISETSKFQASEAGILKASQELLSAVIAIIAEKFWTYQNINNPTNDSESVALQYFVNTTSFVIENLYELGILAATGGKHLIAVLNVSWKGVVSLLQIEVGKEILSSKVNITNIILTLIALVTDSLKALSKIWLSSECKSKTVTDIEARRACIPMKFYLRNALHISSKYPYEAFKVKTDMVSCILKIATICALLSTRDYHKTVYEALTKLLEPISLFFLLFLLKSDQAELELKLKMLDELFTSVRYSDSTEIGNLLEASSEATIDEIFTKTLNNCSLVLFGRVRVLLNLLQNSEDLGSDVVLAISKRLEWLLDAITQEDIYAFALQNVMKIDTASPDSVVGFTSNFMFSNILHAMKMFFIFNASTTAWVEIESFLIHNIIHPHTLCWMLVMELWCFVMQHAHLNVINGNISTLCSLLKSLVYSSPNSPRKSVRRLAQSLCIILKHVPQSAVEYAYSALMKDGSASEKSMVVSAVLLEEGFPLHLLIESSRAHAVQKIVDSFSVATSAYLESKRCSKSLPLPESMICFSKTLSQCGMRDVNINNESILKIPRLALRAVKFLGSVKDTAEKGYHIDVLIQALEIIPHVIQRLRINNITELLISLNSLLISGNCPVLDQWIELKPAIALFLRSLSALEIPEDEGNALSTSVWNLYHFILKERHWAGAHLGLASFGYFAARSSCNELWRFVPQDAALSYDIELGKQCNAELFMSELKSFLEKDGAKESLCTDKEEQDFLKREGLMQFKWKNQLQSSEISSVGGHEPKTPHPEDDMEIDIDKNEGEKTDMRKLKEGICLIRQGLSLLTSHLTQLHHEENGSVQKDQLATQVSCLSDVVNQIESDHC